MEREALAAGDLLHGRFAEVAGRLPDAVAVAGRDGTLGYGELARRAYQLAHRLVADGVRPDDAVAVVAEPDSLDAVVGVLGVWAAGAGCLPVDPATNPARVAHMLAGAGNSVRGLVGAGARAAAYAGRVASAVLLDRDAVAIAAQPHHRPDVAASPDHLAYLVHTSGSTGEPKAVAVTHRGIVATYDGWAAVHGLEARRWTYVQVAGPAFDVYIGDIVRTLLSGGRLVLCDTATALDPPRLCALIERSGADAVELTPTVLRLLLSWAEQTGHPMPALSLVVVGGEAWPVRDCRRLRALLPAARIVNTYGIAETTIDGTFHDVTARDVAQDIPDGEPVPIGRPFPHVSLSILDHHLRPVEPGAVGEVYVRGPALARGYRDRPAATAGRFVPAVGGPPGARMYRTGDLARERPDGVLVFAGRVDDEVKVRGVRGSLGAVEAALCRQPEVAAAAVLRAERGGETVLVAHVVPAGTPDGLAGPLRARLADLLPAALVPAEIEVRDALPVAPSGKLDRRALEPARPALPAPPAPAAGVDGQAVLRAAWTRLLGRPPRDGDEDFFAAGGTSLTAALLARQVGSELGVELPVAAVFTAPTVAGLARHLGAPDPESIVDIGPGTVPLAPGQERLWLLHRMNPLDPRYHQPTLLRLRGPLRLDALRSAFDVLVERHEALRIRFGWDGDRPVQLVDPAGPVPIEIVAAANPADGDRIVDDRIRRPFDLAAGSALRVVLIRYAPERHDLLVVVHHILFDGWSERVLLRELGTAYDAFRAGRVPELPPLPVRWTAVAAWQARRLAGGAGERGRRFWRDNLANLPAPVDLPGPGGTPAGELAERRARIGAELGGRVAGAARDGRTTPSAVLLAALAALLARWSGRPDLVIGTPFADRDRVETEHLIGFLVNTLPLRLPAPSGTAGAELIRRAGEVMANAAAHGDVPFDRIVADAGRSGAGDRNPVFRVWLNLLGEPAAAPALAGLDVEITDPRLPGALFDVSLYVNDRAGGYDLRLVYDRAVLDAGHAAELLDQYLALLDRVCAEPAAPIGAHNLLTPAGRTVLPRPYADLATPPAERGPTLSAGLAESAARHAGRVAVREGGRETSYRDIHRLAAGVAARLAAGGVGPGQAVPVYAARTGNLVPAILGVAASGAAVALLDPGHPAARNAAQLAALAPRVGVTLAGEVPAALRAGCPRWLTVGAPDSGAPAPSPPDRDGPLYVAFTSGTTGRPQGIRGGPGPVAHFLHWYAERFALGPGDRFALLSGLSHDPLLRDVLAPLWVGGTLCVPPAGLRRSPAELRTWLAAERVSVLHLTPPLVRLLGAATTGPILPDVRLLVVAGDVLRGEDLPAVRAWAPAARVVNGYGATETPQLASAYEPGTEAPERGPLPVGVGAPGSQLLVCRAGGRPAAIGELGRVVVRGPHLASGYLGTGPDRFTDDPVSGHRRFDTGDLGRRGPDGTVTIVARDDAQAKVHGVRVELAEVDHWLRTLPGIRDAAAAVRPGRDGENHLVAALVVGAGQQPPDLSGVRGRLRAHLPEPLLPRHVVAVPALPLTPNGKVDRPALARITPPRLAPRVTAVGPGSRTEVLVSGVWRRLLGLDEVDPTANFFDLGGSSLLMPRAQVALAERLGRPVPIAALFEHPTVRGLARYLTGDVPADRPGPARPDRRAGSARLRSLRLAARKGTA